MDIGLKLEISSLPAHFEMGVTQANLKFLGYAPVVRHLLKIVKRTKGTGEDIVKSEDIYFNIFTEISSDQLFFSFPMMPSTHWP